MIDPTQRFSSRVDNYIRYRPSYPAAILDLLAGECGLTPEWAVADVGAGPGNLTRLFLDHSARVVGVEPNREMREAGERLLRGYPTYTRVAGTAEATGLARARQRHHRLQAHGATRALVTGIHQNASERQYTQSCGGNSPSSSSSAASGSGGRPPLVTARGSRSRA
jgi:SAM-dependent methyltransferase